MRLVQRGGTRRQAMVLIVVLAILTLFSIIGVSFVLLADSLAASARIAREAETGGRPDMDPEQILTLFLGQLLYDLPDDHRGVWSGVRGHSLGRNIYGLDDTAGALSDRPFSGTGRLQYPHTVGGSPLSNHRMVNYTYFPEWDKWLRDPEHLGSRLTPNEPKGTYVAEANPPYTYPDHNHMFLAAVRASDGRVLQPSFHRHWLFNPGAGLNEQTNANWTNAQGKYLLIRPRPQEMGPGFPYPEDEGGDVKNWPWAPGGNDSVWIDIGAPVLTSPDGRKYKMLVAPLIIDLDGRINLNVHGNIRGNNKSHVSNQGWGPWEVNLSKVLNDSANAIEWQHLFVGNPGTGTARVAGRYGYVDDPRIPGNGGQGAGGTVPRTWGQVDFDGVNENDPNLPLTPTVSLPGTGSLVPFRHLPGFPAGYGNGVPAEMTNHPSLYNFFTPVHDDRRLPLSELVGLLRVEDTGGYAIPSELRRLCPTQFSDANARIRRQVTTDSFDFGRPATPPYVWSWTLGNDPAMPLYGLATGSTYPRAAAPVTFPDQTERGNTPADGEFLPSTWQSAFTTNLKQNLNQPLRPYPAPTVNGMINFSDPATQTAYNDAVRDRQELARSFYDRLRLATGAIHPDPDPTKLPRDSDAFRALRWLAQLAVNMVDYIDSDSYNTIFTFYADSNNETETVIGTELPGLVLNETYVQLNNVEADKAALIADKKATRYEVDVWLELHNPLTGDSQGATGAATALLWAENDPADPDDGHAIYQIVLAAYNDPTHAQTVLAAPANTLGKTSIAGPPAVAPLKEVILNDWSMLPFHSVDANIDLYKDDPPTNKAFYVLGPDTKFLADADDDDPNIPTTTDPNLQVAAKSDKLKYEVTTDDNPASWKPSIFLQRLACPHLPPNPDKDGMYDNNLPYNPYITVDVARDMEYNDARIYDGDGVNPNKVDLADRASRGRKQPYAGAPTEWVAQVPDPVPTDKPRTTFYRHNFENDLMAPTITDTSNTLKIPFDWLVHLDRQLISPVELFHVSAYKPHQLTTTFVQGGKAHQHTARWLDETTLLYRFLELVETRPRAAGVASGGRTPGKVNINTIFDFEEVAGSSPQVFRSLIFRALCDAQPGNSFYNDGTDGRPTDQLVDEIATALLKRRTPGLLNSADPRPLGENDRPFWGLGLGPAPGGDSLSTAARGIDSTLLSAATVGLGPDAPRLFEPVDDTGLPLRAHPYQRMELLTKLFNNVTTRSNVFAVWLTTGFFEVTDDSTRPVKLGAEIGRSEGRHIRHRMFAIIDRTHMVKFRASTTGGDTITVTTPGIPQQAQLSLENHRDHFGNSITPAPTFATARLTFDPGTDQEETVLAVPDGSGKLQATFLKSHAASAPVVCYGNPGPINGRWLPKEDPCVRYFAIID